MPTKTPLIGIDWGTWTGRHWKNLWWPNKLKTKYYKTRGGAQRMVNILKEYGGCEVREEIINEVA